jgi:hypothetical protein
MSKAIDTRIDRLFAKSQLASRKFYFIWSVLPWVFIFFGFAWSPLALNGKQTLINLIGRSQYGFISLEPFYFRFPTVHQVNTSQHWSELNGASHVLDVHSFNKKMKNDMKFWEIKNLDLNNKLTHATLSMIEIIFQWTMTSVYYCLILHIFFVLYLQTQLVSFDDVNQEQRRRLTKKYKKQKRSLDNVEVNLKKKLIRKLEYGLGELNRKPLSQKERVFSVLLRLLFFGMIHWLFTNLHLTKHTFLGLPEALLELKNVPSIQRVVNQKKISAPIRNEINNTASSPCSTRDRFCFGSMNWIGWIKSNPAKDKLIPKYSIDLAPYQAECDRHMTGMIESGIAFYRKKFPGPHAIGSFLNSNLLFPDKHAMDRMVYEAHSEEFKNLFYMEVLDVERAKEIILERGEDEYLRLIGKDGKLRKEVFENTKAPFDSLIEGQAFFLTIEAVIKQVLESKEFAKLSMQYQPSAPTEADVFNVLAKLNKTMSISIIASGMSYATSTVGAIIAFVLVCACVVLASRCCRSAPPRPPQERIVGDGIPLANTESFGPTIKFSPHMQSRFIKSKQAMRLHLSENVELGPVHKLLDWFSQQLCCCRFYFEEKQEETETDDFEDSFWQLNSAAASELHVEEKRPEEKILEGKTRTEIHVTPECAEEKKSTKLWKLGITAQNITESQGVTVTQVGGATGTLYTALAGTGMTSIIISTASGITFLTTADVVIGSTTILHANVNTAMYKNVKIPKIPVHIFNVQCCCICLKLENFIWVKSLLQPKKKESQKEEKGHKWEWIQRWCCCGKHATRFFRCRHPFVESWNLSQCNVCKKDLGEKREEKETIKKNDVARRRRAAFAAAPFRQGCCLAFNI